MQDAMDNAIAFRDLLGSSNFYISAPVGLAATVEFIRRARRVHARNPPTGAAGLVLFEATTLTALCISVLRIMTGAFDGVMHTEEAVCFFVGSLIIAYMLFSKLSHAFSFANKPLEPGHEPNTEDFWAGS